MKKFIILFSVLFLASCEQNAIQIENQNISGNSEIENNVKVEMKKTEEENNFNSEIKELINEYNELVWLGNEIFKEKSDILLKKYYEDKEKISQKFDSLLLKKHFDIFQENNQECFEIKERQDLQHGFFVELTCNLVKLYYQDVEIYSFSTAEFLKRNTIDFDFLQSYSRDYILKNSYDFWREDENGFVYFVLLTDKWKEEWSYGPPTALIIDTKDKKLVTKTNWIATVLKFDKWYVLQQVVYVDPEMRLELLYDDRPEHQIAISFEAFEEALRKKGYKEEEYVSVFREWYITEFKEVEWGFSVIYAIDVNGNQKKFEIFIDSKYLQD